MISTKFFGIGLVIAIMMGVLAQPLQNGIAAIPTPHAADAWDSTTAVFANNETLIDQVLLCPVNGTPHQIALGLQKDYFYRAEFEMFFDWPAEVSAKVHLITPDGYEYLWLEKEFDDPGDEKLEFGIGRTGVYTLRIDVESTVGTMLWLRVQEFDRVDQYYMARSLYVIDPTQVAITTIETFTETRRAFSYTFPVTADWKYRLVVFPAYHYDGSVYEWMNISYGTAPRLACNLTFPEWTLSMVTDEPLENHFMANILDLPRERFLEDATSRILATYLKGDITIRVELNTTYGLDLDVAILFYADRPIGDGPTKEGEAGQPENDWPWDDEIPNATQVQSWEDSVIGFFRTHGNSMMIVSATIFVAAYFFQSLILKRKLLGELLEYERNGIITEGIEMTAELKEPTGTAFSKLAAGGDHEDLVKKMLHNILFKDFAQEWKDAIEQLIETLVGKAVGDHPMVKTARGALKTFIVESMLAKETQIHQYFTKIKPVAADTPAGASKKSPKAGLLEPVNDAVVIDAAGLIDTELQLLAVLNTLLEIKSIYEKGGGL